MQSLITGIQAGHTRTLARFISWVENDVPGYEEVLTQLKFHPTPIVGNQCAGWLLAEPKLAGGHCGS
jgi:putative protein kinase ArgK-like GTPase of G3E family